MESQKVYELTTNEKDGFAKWYVRGIKDDNEAKLTSLKGFGVYYSKSLISYYDNYPSEYGTNWKTKSLTIKKFLEKTKYLRVKKYMQTGTRKSISRDRARSANPPSAKERRRNRTDAIGSRL